MSFRTRLTTFFVLIVVVPMIAVGFLVLRLISDCEQGKADARANGVLSAAVRIYQTESDVASGDAQTIARDLSAQLAGGTLMPAALRARVASLASQAGLARVTLTSGSTTLVDVGDPTAIAPGSATIAGRQTTVTVSELTAGQYARELTVPGVAVVVRVGPQTLAATGVAAADRSPPTAGSVSIHGAGYRAESQTLLGFGGTRLTVTVLSSISASAGSVTGSRVLAIVFIVAFLLLAFSFSVLASKGLQGQISRFLQAARRLGSGDFSSPIQVAGHDEFAALGEEFNSMSSQLANRLDELSQERARLREAIRRIGQTFASNLDRPALLELALKTAVDAAQASAGRVSIRDPADGALAEAIREGSLAEVDAAIYQAERAALESGDLSEGAVDGQSAISMPLRPLEAGGRIHGLITVAAVGRSFTEDDREVLRSLGAQAALALENVDLHVQVSRQAVTDELTGLANHGRFQDLLGAEAEQVRRYHHSVGLIMLDIDDFKSVNDTYGHQQGDVVLKGVARVVADSSREVDYPARYGGEEMAVILPHTGLEGAYAIAERIRTAIEDLRVPRVDQQGTLRITASVGVAASTEGSKDGLIADADAALYEAKRQGKNRTVRAPVEAANVVGGE
ncbi:MAG TPA: diguanylate cyclase [Solirubrobacteraceae bacterium]|nr:diguanylate cyclase [Solirubrobacteraceae bacterium]